MFLFDTCSRIERIELDSGSRTANIYHMTNHDLGTHDSLLMGAVFDVTKPSLTHIGIVMAFHLILLILLVVFFG